MLLPLQVHAASSEATDGGRTSNNPQRVCYLLQCKAPCPLSPQQTGSPLLHDRAVLVAIAVHVVLQVMQASPVSVRSPVAQSTPNHIDDINRLVMETIERSRSHPEHVSLASMAANRSRSPGGRPPAVAHRRVLMEDSESSDDERDLLPRAKLGRKLATSKHLHMHSLYDITFLMYICNIY